MNRTNLITKMQEMYGTPSGYLKERRKVFFEVPKPIDEVIRELRDEKINISSEVYVLINGRNTLLSVDN